MSRGRSRITALEPSPFDTEKSGSAVGTVNTFRSNVSDDHFVVGFDDGLGEYPDGAPMAYVDRRAAVDLAFHFAEVATDLGAQLVVTNVVGQKALWDSAYEAGLRQGRTDLRDELQAHLNAV